MAYTSSIPINVTRSSLGLGTGDSPSFVSCNFSLNPGEFGTPQISLGAYGKIWADQYQQLIFSPGYI